MVGCFNKSSSPSKGSFLWKWQLVQGLVKANSPPTLLEWCGLHIQSLGSPSGKLIPLEVATAWSLGTHAMCTSFCVCRPKSKVLLPSPLQSLFALTHTQTIKKMLFD